MENHNSGMCFSFYSDKFSAFMVFVLSVVWVFLFSWVYQIHAFCVHASKFIGKCKRHYMDHLTFVPVIVYVMLENRIRRRARPNSKTIYDTVNDFEFPSHILFFFAIQPHQFIIIHMKCSLVFGIFIIFELNWIHSVLLSGFLSLSSFLRRQKWQPTPKCTCCVRV